MERRGWHHLWHSRAPQNPARFPLYTRNVIVRVLEDVVQCHKLGVEYTPARKAGCGGHNKLILLGSLEEQIVADNMESGLGLTQTTRLVNVYRREEGLLDVGRSADGFELARVS